MNIEILGAGGATGVPRPFCTCLPCTNARAKGLPHTRYGPSLFIHDLNLLIDTPEEIAIQLNRANIAQVDALLYSHWHPDHTAGSRVFEANYGMNSDYWALPIYRHCTMVYLPERVARTFEENHGLQTRLDYLQRGGVIAVEVIPTGASIQYRDQRITPVDLQEDIACSFLIEDGQRGKRILIAMDETFEWQPPAWLGKLDLVIMPAGIFEFHPLQGQRLIPTEHPLLKREATFEQTMDMIRALDTPRVIFSHLNHSDYLTHEEYREVAARVNAAGTVKPEVSFAYDGMRIEV